MNIFNHRFIVTMLRVVTHWFLLLWRGTLERSELHSHAERGNDNSPPCSTVAISVDSTGVPIVTNEMKAECIGEFTWEEEWPYYDKDGNLHEDHVHAHTVPWTVCKEIYKRMALVAMKSR